MKILLVLTDGMRPDAIRDNPTVKFLLQNGTSCMNAQTVMPSVTLPVHMSLFHSVDPGRHGVTTNVYTPQVQPVSGLFEQLSKKGLRCAMFYNWEELRDLSRPGSLYRSVFVSQEKLGIEEATKETFRTAKSMLKGNDIDFAFVYFGWADEAGHATGWMSKEYLRAANESCDMVGELIKELASEYTIIYAADHGGHDRMHGTSCPEDMTIPMFFLGKPFAAGKKLEGLNIKDIAPTVASLLGAEIPSEWEGKIIH